MADGTVAGIQLEGIDIRIDQELFADALDGAVEVRNSTIAVGGAEESDARLTLTGDAVTIGEGSSLQAQYREGGGLIEVGGSWQNSDETVRQATTAVVEAGAVLDASAGEEGDGGEIVVWSDIKNPESSTIVSGELMAKGGVDQGNGGRIETSGYMLDVHGIQIDTSAEKGIDGLWLLDPRDIIIMYEFSSGLSGTKYEGYFADDLSFFDNATVESDTRFASPFTSIDTTTPGKNFDETYSVRFIGYFKAPASGQFTFKTTSDDASYLWIGSDATESVESFESTITRFTATAGDGALF